jgi:DNA modification methylase
MANPSQHASAEYRSDPISFLMNDVPAWADLVFAAPPLMPGAEYDAAYEPDEMQNKYMDWTGRWMSACYRALKPYGTMWVAVAERFASELDILARCKLELHKQGRVIWHYGFRKEETRRFRPSHVHLFHYTKHPEMFTFNTDAAAFAPATINGKKAKAIVADDVWVLDPTAWPANLYEPESDVWGYPDPKAKANLNSKTLPSPLLHRIISVTSNVGDMVLDPFCGKGSALVAAVELRRRHFGLDRSDANVQASRMAVTQALRKRAASAPAL